MGRRTQKEIALENEQILARINKMTTVEDMFWWKNLKNEKVSVEKMNEDNINELGWSKPDVLHSFLGIYVIGLFAYYPDKFHKKNYKILNEEQKDLCLDIV